MVNIFLLTFSAMITFQYSIEKLTDFLKSRKILTPLSFRLSTVSITNSAGKLHVCGTGTNNSGEHLESNFNKKKKVTTVGNRKS
jgi:hypothetical protein